MKGKHTACFIQTLLEAGLDTTKKTKIAKISIRLRLASLFLKQDLGNSKHCFNTHEKESEAILNKTHMFIFVCNFVFH